MIDNINGILQAILDDFLTSTGELLLPAKLIAGIGAIILAFVRLQTKLDFC